MSKDAHRLKIQGEIMGLLTTFIKGAAPGPWGSYISRFIKKIDFERKNCQRGVYCASIQLTS